MRTPARRAVATALALSLGGLACERAPAPRGEPAAGDGHTPITESPKPQPGPDGPRAPEPPRAEAAPSATTPITTPDATHAATPDTTPAATPAAAPEPAPERECPGGFALDATRPVRVTWPLDIGPDIGLDIGPDAGTDTRPCLRARQGANEIQLPGEGRALFGFRVARSGRHRTFLRVRWLDDGVGSVDCNNSWFAAIDGAAPAVVGNDNERTGWHWEPGPSAELAAGVHWLRVELREDGVSCDRLAVVPEGANAAASALDALPLIAPAGFEGERPPAEPQSPVCDTEIAALRTRSVVIGEGHANEVTVLVSYQARAGAFRGRVAVEAPTAPGIVIEGDAEIACDARAPHAAARLALRFPPDAERRIHPVRVRVMRDDGACVFEEGLRFTKPFAWAFLGPFPDPTRGRAGLTRMTDRELAPLLRALARRAAPEEIARLRLPVRAVARTQTGGAGGPSPDWRVMDDGSCLGELGEVDMFRAFGRRGNCFAYAVTWIVAETRLNHRSFTLSADDTASLWIGGRLVAAMPGLLPREANRLWSSAPLAPGMNPVVVKIAQGSRYWGFRLDVVDWHWQGRRGDVIRGAEPADWPRE